MPDKMVVLVANVGERDLYYNIGDADNPDFCHFELGKDDEKQVAEYLRCQNGARFICEKILQRLQENENEFQRLRYPILKTVLDDGVLQSSKAIDKLILVVTDQPPPPATPERFYRRDSLNSGHVLKLLIQRDYPSQVREIAIVPYRENLSQAREQGYAFFGEILPKIAPEPEVKEFHACLSGGIPALNDSLQEQALRLYKAKGRFYEVIPPPEEELRAGTPKGTLQPVSAKPFLRDLAISVIEQLLNRYDYSGALEVLKMFRAVKFWDDESEAILQHAEQRINLNFEEAAEAIKSYCANPQISEWYNAVSEVNQIRQLIETYYIAKARYEHHEYADLLWRIRLIYESIKEEVQAHLSDPEWKMVGEAFSSLSPLIGLAGRVLHPARGEGIRRLRGISKKEIADNFRAPLFVAAKHGTPSNKGILIISTLKTIIEFLWSQKNKGPLPQNPYDQINNYLKKKLERSQS